MQTRFNVRSLVLYGAAFVIGALVMVGVGALLTNIQQRKDEGLARPLQLLQIPSGSIDPAVWGQNFPREYERFQMTERSDTRTTYGGSVAFSRLELNPALVRLWAGYAFAVDYNEERGHFYALQDQKDTKRTHDPFSQPGACINCHAGEAPALIAEMGWENFNHTPYNDLRDKLHTGSTCADCHDPATMALRITRPALINALQARGIDWTKATRQEMRSLVCNQCHVEYYFDGENKVLTFPWKNGMTIDAIDQYYIEDGHIDWTNKETGVPSLKMQHPETELYSTSLHAANGVACADCHMPYIRDGAVKISDHWIRSPLTNVETACQQCHNVPKEDLEARILTIQNRNHELLGLTEAALLDSMDAIIAARQAGATDETLKTAMDLNRRAQMRWDFVSSENSMGFHSPQEAARVLAAAIDLARQAQMAAVLAKP